MRAPATGGATWGNGRFLPKLSAPRPFSGPYNPGGWRGEAGVRAISLAGRPVPAWGGGDNSPCPSRVSAGARTLLSEIGATPTDNATRRRSISTNNPDNGRLDQSALAVTWNSTTRPAPSVASVTSGVPSSSAAHVRPARSAVGSASPCRFTLISSVTGRPAKGDIDENPARAAGWLQDIAPPSCRSPASNRTGISVSVSFVAASAVRGPAKRISKPPLRTQASNESR